MVPRLMPSCGQFPKEHTTPICFTLNGKERKKLACMWYFKPLFLSSEQGGGGGKKSLDDIYLYFLYFRTCRFVSSLRHLEKNKNQIFVL